MYNKHFKTNLRAGRAFFATLMLLMLTTDFAFGQTTPLCQQLASILPSPRDIDVVNNTNTMPSGNFLFPTLPPLVNIKGAKDRLVLISGKILITNTIVIFENCDIRMFKKIDEEAGFIVPSGTTLIFKHCRIAAADCQKIWNTIEVQGGKLVMIDGNEVEDARSVITKSPPDCEIKCENNQFNRNYVGITLTGNLQDRAKYSIQYNMITNNGAPLIPTGNTGRTPIYGIIATNTKFIKLQGMGFINLSCAIFLSNSNLYFDGGNIRDIAVNSIQLGITAQGSGVYLQNKSKAQFSRVWFDNCELSGITAKESSIDCQNSRFLNTRKFAIFLPDHSIPNLGGNVIKNNVFSENSRETEHYIILKKTIPGNDVIIGNTFTLSNAIPINTSHVSCIEVNSILSKCDVYNNIFEGTFPNTVNGPFEAINLFNSGIFNIANNSITATKSNSSANTNPYIGIKVDNTESANITNNTINSNLDIGIRLSNAPLSTLCSNTMNKPSKGLFLTNLCNETNVFSSTFSNNSSHAIFVEGNSTGLPDQLNHGNIFAHSITSNTVEHTGADYQSSPFYYNDGLSSCGKPEFKPMTIMPKDWFIQNDLCENSCSPQLLTSSNVLSEHEEDILNSRLGNYAYSSSQIWQSNYTLYNRLTLHPLLRNIAIADNFYNDAQNGNIGKFYTIQQEIDKAISFNGDYDSNGQNLVEAKESKLEILNEKYDIWVTDSTNVNAWSAYINAVEQFDNAQASLDNYTQQYVNYRNSVLANANSLNTNIEPIGIMETNLKSVNSLRIKYYSGIELTESEWSFVKQIAELCAKEGGHATMRAQQLIAGQHHYTYNYNNCLGSYSGKVKSNGLNENISIFPNPASHELNILYKKSKGGNNRVYEQITH